MVLKGMYYLILQNGTIIVCAFTSEYGLFTLHFRTIPDMLSFNSE